MTLFKLDNWTRPVRAVVAVYEKSSVCVRERFEIDFFVYEKGFVCVSKKFYLL